MGGDGHGHGGGIPKIPDWKSYRVEDVPELMQVQRKLANHGLKDPWLRNEVWRYHPGFGTIKSRVVTFLTRGLKWGVVAFVATIALEKAFGIDYGHGGHHEEHGEHH